MKQIEIRAVGAKLQAHQEPLAIEILKQQNRLWNALVEIENDSRLKYQAAVVQSDPELADLNGQAEAEQLVMDALLEAKSKDRQQQRKKKTANADTYNSKIKECSTRLKDLRRQMKDCKLRARLAAKPKTDAIEQERRALVKAKVKEFEMWWAHSETVLAKFDVARIKAMKEGAILRFHRYDGNGSFGVRVSMASSMFKLKDIMDGRTSMCVIRDCTDAELGPMKAQKADGGRRVMVEMRAGSKAEGGPAKLSFLTTIHAGRDFPEHLPLKTVTAKRELHVNKAKWKLVFMFSDEVEDTPLPELPKEVVGIDFGWRMVQDGENKALRVATLIYKNSTEFVSLDSDWLYRMELADKVRSQLDDSANLFAEKLLPLLREFDLKQLGETHIFRILAEKTLRAKRAYSSLLIALCDAHKNYEMPLGPSADVWMQVWKHQAIAQSLKAHHIRRKAIDHRKHIYRNLAADLVKRVGLFGIEDIRLAGLATVKSTGFSEDNELLQIARKHRTWASIYELKSAILQAAKRERREVLLVDAKDTTRMCSHCGHIHGEAIKDLVFTCDSCNSVFDQDVNAARNCRNAALGLLKPPSLTSA